MGRHTEGICLCTPAAASGAPGEQQAEPVGGWLAGWAMLGRSVSALGLVIRCEPALMVRGDMISPDDEALACYGER